MFTTVSLRKGLKTLLAVAAVSTLGVSSMTINACSSADAAPSDDPAPTLNGRYAITSTTGTAPYRTMWFGSKDKIFEGVLSECESNCTRTGSFTYENGRVNITSTDGGPSIQLNIKPSGALAPKSLRIRAEEPPAEAEEGAVPENECDTTLILPPACRGSIPGFTDEASGTNGKLESLNKPDKTKAYNCKGFCTALPGGNPGDREKCSINDNANACRSDGRCRWIENKMCK